MGDQSMVFHVRGGGVKDASVDCSTVICFLSLSMVLQTLLQGLTRPTWAYPAHYLLALASSVLPMPRSLTRLAECLPGCEPGGDSARRVRERGIGRTEEANARSEEHTSELQSHSDLVCRLLLEKK